MVLDFFRVMFILVAWALAVLGYCSLKDITTEIRKDLKDLVQINRENLKRLEKLENDRKCLQSPDRQ